MKVVPRAKIFPGPSGGASWTAAGSSIMIPRGIRFGKLRPSWRKVSFWGLLDHSLAGPDFREAGIFTGGKRADRPEGPGHENGRLDGGVRIVEGTNRSASRIVLGRAEIGEGLVAADVEGANGDRFAFEAFDDLAVQLVLILAVGEVAAGHVGKLGPIEPDPLGAVAQGDFDVADQADVGTQVDALVVVGRGRNIAKNFQSAQFAAAVGCQSAIFVDMLPVGRM